MQLLLMLLKSKLLQNLAMQTMITKTSVEIDINQSLPQNLWEDLAKNLPEGKPKQLDPVISFAIAPLKLGSYGRLLDTLQSMLRVSHNCMQAIDTKPISYYIKRVHFGR